MTRSRLLALGLIVASGIVAPAHAAHERPGHDQVVLAEWRPRNWRLPVTDRYETYDPHTGRRAAVDEATVAERIRRGEWIFDRSTGAWVSGPGDDAIRKSDGQKGGGARLGYRNQGQGVSAAARVR
jgi:hypothetical protein